MDVNEQIHAQLVKAGVRLAASLPDGERIRLESTAGILGKKLLYEASCLKPRDAFDIAAAIRAGRCASWLPYSSAE